MKAAGLLLILITSCAKVEDTGSEDAPTETFVRYTLDWAGQTDVPSEMTVAMGRIINAIHFSCKMDSLGTMTAVTQDSTMTSCDTLTGLKMPNGEYYVMAFNADGIFNLNGYREFVTHKAASMRSICIEAPHFSEEEFSATIGDNFADFNPTQGYIKGISPAFLDVQKVNIHPEIDTIVTISPEPISQEITFRIMLETEGNVQVQKVNGEISGVPGAVQLLTRHISDTVTYRVPFTMEAVGTNGAATIYEGKVCVLGLFPSTDASYSTGPGILQLSVRAMSEGHERMFRAGINLKEQIGKAGLVERASDNERLFRIGVPEAFIEVDSKLKIKENQIVLGGDGQGVGVGFEHEDFEFEI